MMYPEILLVFRKDRKNVTADTEKEETFLVVTIEAIIVHEYVRIQKGMKSVASSLERCREIGNVVRV